MSKVDELVGRVDGEVDELVERVEGVVVKQEAAVAVLEELVAAGAVLEEVEVRVEGEVGAGGVGGVGGGWSRRISGSR